MLAGHFEIHYTPKQGSWLNIAEIELSALCRQLLPDGLQEGSRIEARHVLFPPPRR